MFDNSAFEVLHLPNFSDYQHCKLEISQMILICVAFFKKNLHDLLSAVNSAKICSALHTPNK